MNTKLLAICISSFNNFKYLPELIDQINSQYDEVKDYIEVLIYDDCSTDNNTIDYLNSINEYQVINGKKNSGSPSLGRNIMVKSACAKYILFIDGDDLLTCPIEDLLNEVRELDNDLLLSFPYNMKDNIKTDSIVKFNETLYNCSDEQFNNHKHKYVVHQTSIRHLYKRDFLIHNNIQSPIDIRHEDHVFNHEVLAHKPNIGRLQSRYYGWRLNEESWSNYSNFTQMRLDFIKCELKMLSKYEFDDIIYNEITYNLFDTLLSTPVRGYPKLSFKEKIKYFNTFKHYFKDFKYNGDYIDTDIYFKLWYKYKVTNVSFFLLLSYLYKVNQH